MKRLALLVGIVVLAGAATGAFFLQIGTHADVSAIATGIICFAAVAGAGVVGLVVCAFVALAERVRHRRFAK